MCAEYGFFPQNTESFFMGCTGLQTLDRYDAHVRHNVRLTLWRTLMAYLVLSPHDEESLKKFLSQDPNPDHLRGEDRAMGRTFLV